MPDWKEALGFLCRWCVLALACLAVVVVAWASVVASAEAGGDLPAEITVTDAVWGVWDRPGDYLTGYANPPMPKGGPDVILSGGPGTALVLNRPAGGKVDLCCPAVRAGANPMRIVGVPYGRYALYKTEGLLELVPPRRDVCLVDAAMVPPVGTKDEPAFRECLRALLGRCEVAFFHNGPLGRYMPVRTRLRSSYGNIPVLFSQDDQARPNTLSRAAWTLYQHTDRPVVVTGSAELAAWAAADGFPVHLVGRGPAGGARRGLAAHESWVKFKDSLRAEPIRP